MMIRSVVLSMLASFKASQGSVRATSALTQRIGVDLCGAKPDGNSINPGSPVRPADEGTKLPLAR